MTVWFTFLLVAILSVPHVGGASETVRGASPDDQAMYDLIASAHSGDRRIYDRGRLEFTIDYQPPPSQVYGPFRPVRARGRVVWRGDKALWVYKAQDPDGFCFGTKLGVELDEAPLRYRLVEGNIYHAYNSSINQLIVKETSGYTAASIVLEVRPASLWFRCCPPRHVEGRPWIEMIGPSSPVMGPGPSIAIDRDGDLIRQTRTLADGSTSETTFSMEWDGNVVRHHFNGTRRDSQNRIVTYEWGRSAGGTCVLRRCEARLFETGSKTKIKSHYTLTIDSVDLERPVRPTEVSRAALLAMLPRDVVIDDQIADKRYFANPDVKVPATRLERLAGEIAGEGFLRPRD